MMQAYFGLRGIWSGLTAKRLSDGLAAYGSKME
jgi:hypothetical protein